MVCVPVFLQMMMLSCGPLLWATGTTGQLLTSGTETHSQLRSQWCDAATRVLWGLGVGDRGRGEQGCMMRKQGQHSGEKGGAQAQLVV